jgi:multimeric flavodoxin WrbA
MKVLGVVGSLRKDSNTDILVDKVLSGAEKRQCHRQALLK